MLFYCYADVAEWLIDFDYKTSYDYVGDKHYFFFEDSKGNTFTIMKYKDGAFTIHSKSKTHCDENELLISTDKLLKFVWKNRKEIHKVFKG
jgi:hypothetical protein